MHPFECINEACKNLIKHKGLQIIVESMTGEVEDWPSVISRGSWNMKISMPAKINYNVTIRLNHNFSIELVFLEDDFDPNKPWGIEQNLKLAGLDEDDKQIARFMYFFWELSKYISAPRVDTGPMGEFIFMRTRTIRQTL